MASFAGTIEENKLRRSLKDVFQLMERTHFLLNTVINSCNGTKGVPFTSADVVLQDELDVISDCMNWESESETERNIILPYKDVLNIDLLSRVVQNGVTEIPGECNKIFDPLFAFMRDMSKHEKAISSFKGSKEADVMVVLGLHLFSQLIPQSGQSIEMDCMSTKQNKCPCKLERCDRTVDLTCTAIGSPLTWHGYADIILNKQIPIAFLDKKKKEGDVTENCWEQSKIPEDDSECPGPSSRKRRKESCGDDETTGDKKEVQANLVVEVKKGSQRGSFLVEDKLGQLISQTVTNAFVQVKKSQPDRDLLFPSFGCSSEEIYFFMYDPVNDILLRSSHVISLFLPLSEKFDLRAIIIIWIFLNFTAFVKPDLAKEYQLKESNFHKLARNCLCYYKEGTFKQRFKSDQTSLDPQSLLKLLIERGELAKKKK